MTYLLFILGFVALGYGASWLIDGAVLLARRFHAPEILIGLTVVAFGTSAPEFFVNLVASFYGEAEIVVANIVGSNIANLTLALGGVGMLVAFQVPHGLLKKEIPLGILGALAIYLLAQQIGEGELLLSRFAGGVFLLGFLIFLGLIYRDQQQHEVSKVEVTSHKLPIAFLLTGGGLLTLALGGELVVKNAVLIAEQLGFSQSLVGLTLVALGTSLPEIVTSLVAVFKRQGDLALGNVIGSNVFNIFWVLGLSALIKPIVFPADLEIDLLILIGLNLFLLGAVFWTQRLVLTRTAAALLFVSYFGYLYFIFLRG